MARFPQSEAKKGSQKWIQRLVNDKPEILNTQIRSTFKLSDKERINWLSPLKKDDYAEYRDKAFLVLLGIKLERNSLTEFWPSRGPQWDALAKSSSGKLFLVEAKSHIPELFSSLQASDPTAIKKIRKSLEETKTYLGASANVDWSEHFYQYANRLAHLYLLQKNDLPAYLIHVYFIKDAEMNGPESSLEWQGATKLLNSYLGIGRHKLQNFVADLYFDIGALQ
jgi:hypothetical protein